MKTAFYTNDGDLRAALRRELWCLYQHDAHTVIIEELGILHGSSRVDVAVVNGNLHGYELKSDRDDLQRLPGQALAFAKVFDLMTLVVSERHLHRALDLIPDWWGIRVARMESGRIIFRDLKLPLANPAPDAMSVVRLLWRNEAFTLAREIPVPVDPAARKRDSIYRALVNHADLDVLRARIRQCLKSRQDWRAAAPPQ